MLTAVNLDNEPAFEADEINDVGADRRLTAEAVTIELPSSELPPQ